MFSQNSSTVNRFLLVFSALVGISLLILSIVIIMNANKNKSEVIHLGEVGSFDEDETHRRIIEPPQQITDFTLVASNNTPVSLTDFQGRLVLLYFGYTNCPDACPATLLDFKRIKAALGEEAEHVQFMMISVDPERDTRDVLDSYINGYDPSFVGATGTHESLQEITQEFDVVYARNDGTTSQAGYLVDHTVSKFLIDQDGRLVRVYTFLAKPSLVVEDILNLLN